MILTREKKIFLLVILIDKNIYEFLPGYFFLIKQIVCYLLNMTKKIMRRMDITATPSTMPATMVTWDSLTSTNPGRPGGGVGVVVGGTAVM